MARGQEVRYTLTADSRGFTAGAAAAAGSLDKVNASAARSSAATAAAAAQNTKLAGSLSAVTANVARYGAALGVPVGALRLLTAAEDAASLGAKNLTKSMAGFNAASVGVAGAGLALGFALGSLARQWDVVANAADKAAKSVWQAMFGGEMTPHGLSAAERARQLENSIRADAQAQVARLDQIKLLAKGGLNSDQIQEELDIQAGTRLRATAGEQEITAMRKREEAAKRAALAAAEAARRAAEAWTDAAEKARAEWEKFYQTLAQGHVSSTLNPKTGETVLVGAAAGVQDVLGKRAVERADQRLKEWMAATGLGSDEVAGPPADLIVTVRDANEGYADSLQNVSRGLFLAGDALQFLGVSASSAVVRLLNSVGAGMQLGGQIGGMFGPQGAVIGSVIGGAVGLFGGGDDAARRERQKQLLAQQVVDMQALMDARDASRASGVAGIVEHGPAFFEGLGPNAGRQYGALFAAAWAITVKEEGIVAAADAFRDVFDRMREEFADEGLPDFLKDIGLLMDLSLDEEFKRLAEAAHTAASFLQALGEAGVLGPEAFLAMQQRALELFSGGAARAVELGKSPDEAQRAGFAVVAPLLQELVDQSVLQNQTLTPEVQELVNQSGIVPSVHFQQLDELRAIRQAVQRMAGINGGDGAVPGSGAGAGPGGGGGGGVPRPDKPGYAKGGRIERDPSGRGWDVRVGEEQAEWIVPESELGAFAKSVLSGRTSTAGGLSGSMSEAAVSVSAPLTLNLTVGKGVRQGEVDQIVGAVEDALARQTSKIPRLLVKAGFVRR